MNLMFLSDFYLLDTNAQVKYLNKIYASNEQTKGEIFLEDVGNGKYMAPDGTIVKNVFYYALIDEEGFYDQTGEHFFFKGW